MINDFLENINQLPMKWNYFSDFSKLNSLSDYESEIKLLNKLLGEKETNINEKLIEIVKDNNRVVEVLILLLAIKPNKLKELYIHSSSKIEDNPDLLNTFRTNPIALIYFFEKSGLKKMFIEKFVDNLEDYLKGIIIGLDTNSRKNRSGLLMETECEKIISKWCSINNYVYFKQKRLRHIDLNKKFDFVIKINDKYIAIEVNNYSSSGSKIKSTSEEYIQLNALLNSYDIIFVWVTNGNGWHKNKSLLKKNLDNIEHLLNLKMLKSGYLDKFII